MFLLFQDREDEARYGSAAIAGRAGFMGPAGAVRGGFAGRGGFGGGFGGHMAAGGGGRHLYVQGVSSLSLLPTGYCVELG